MKKLLYIIPFILLLLIITIIVVLFTPFGSNTFIKPLLNRYLEKKIPKPKIKITQLDSKLNTIHLKAVASNGINAEASGDINYLQQKFDLNYHLFAKNVIVDNRDVLMNLNLLGQAVGSTKSFGVNGMGRAFDSDVEYKFIIKEGEPQAITVSLNSAEIAKMFAFASMQPLANGFLFINAKLPSLDPKNPHGSAHIEIQDGIFNQRLIAKKFGFVIPQDEKFTAKLDTKVAGKYIVGRGNIDATSAKINIQKLTSTLNFQQLKSYYTLKIEKLSRLGTLLKMPLQGKMDLYGALYYNAARALLQLNAATKSFGGIAKCSLNNKKLHVTLKHVSIPSLLKTIEQPKFVTNGTLSGSLNLKNYQKLNGSFKIASSGKLNKKLLRVALPSYKYNIKSEGVLKDATLFAKNTLIRSHFINAKFSNSRYSFLSGVIDSEYTIDIKDLSGLNSINKIPMQGPLKLSGVLKSQGKSTTATFLTHSLEGTLKGEYLSNTLKSDFTNISLVKLLYMFQIPHYFTKAYASGNIHMTDLKREDGLFTVQSKGGIDRTTLQKLTNLELTAPLNYSLLIKNGVIKSGRILTRPQLLTSYGKFDFDYFNYDSAIDKLSTKFRVTIDDLSKLNSITKQHLQGSFTIDSEIKKEGHNLLVTATAKELNGVINMILKNNILTVDAAGISVVELLKTLSYNPVLDGIAIAHLQYDTNSQSGKFKITIDEARFLNSPLVNILKESAQFDLSKEVFSRARINGTIKGKTILFNLYTHSQRTKVTIEHGLIDTKKNTIDARVVVTLNNLDYVFKLRGPLNEPHVILSFSGQVQKKVMSVVKKAILGKDSNATLNKIIPKELKDKKIQEEIKKVIPKEIKGLFQHL